MRKIKKRSKLATEGRLKYVMMTRKWQVVYLSRSKPMTLKIIDSCKEMRTLSKQSMHSNISVDCVGEMRVNATVVTFDKIEIEEEEQTLENEPSKQLRSLFNKSTQPLLCIKRNCNGVQYTQQNHVPTGLDRVPSYDLRRKRETEIERKRTATITRWLILTKLFLEKPNKQKKTFKWKKPKFNLRCMSNQRVTKRHNWRLFY